MSLTTYLQPTLGWVFFKTFIYCKQKSHLENEHIDMQLIVALSLYAMFYFSHDWHIHAVDLYCRYLLSEAVFISSGMKTKLYILLLD